MTSLKQRKIVFLVEADIAIRSINELNGLCGEPLNTTFSKPLGMIVWTDVSYRVNAKQLQTMLEELKCFDPVYLDIDDLKNIASAPAKCYFATLANFLVCFMLTR